MKLPKHILYNCIASESRSIESDTDSGKGTMTSYDSVNSLDSSGTASTNLSSMPAVTEDPEHFQVKKQQKEIWEHGIEM